MNRLHAKTVLITGAAQGIGYHLTHHFLAKGDQVVAVDSNKAGLQMLQARHLEAFNLTTLFTDVSKEEEVMAAIAKTIETYGRLDALINNAAIACNKPLETLAAAEWRRVIDVNLTGSFLLAKHGAPHLRATKGCIINLASTRALMSEPNTEAYSASKGGIIALTHALAMSLGPEVRVNSISPGWVDVSHLQHPISAPSRTSDVKESDHKQHPCGRIGKAEDIATIADYLISDAASFITAQNFIVDGGMTKKMIYE